MTNSINSLKAKVLFPCMFEGNLPADLERAYEQALIVLQAKDWVSYSLLINTHVSWTKSIKTAGTDGAHVYINPAFFMGLPTVSQQAFLLGHEVLHIILRHPQRGAFYRKRGFHSMQGSQKIDWDARQYNIDADAVINADLVAHGLEFIPAGVMRDEVSRDHLVDAVYVESMLKRQQDADDKSDEPEQDQQQQDQQQDDEQQDQQSGGDSDDESGDEQDDEQGDESGESGDESDDESGESDDEQGGESGGEPEPSDHGGHDDHFEPQYEGTEEEQNAAAAHDKAEVERRVDEALDAMDDEVLANGKQPEPSASVVGGSFRHNQSREASDTDWKSELADVLVSAGSDGEQTWSRINRRSYVNLGVVRPTYVGKIEQIAITVDISASVSRERLNAFLTELAALLDALEPTSGCLILWTNTRVVHVDEVYSGQELLDLKVPKGGGTWMSAGSDWLEEAGLMPDVHLCFTDGFIDSTDWNNMGEAGVVVVLDREPCGYVGGYAKASGARVIVAAQHKLAA